jgi:membrane protein
MAEAIRGRAAESPRDIDAAGWRDIGWRVKDAISADNVSMVAAAVAFYALFALFPAMTAGISIYGLVADPQQVQQQIEALSGALPEDARNLLGEQLQNIAGSPPAALGFGLIGGLLVALWSANAGTRAMVEALNIVYGETERRGFIKLIAFTLALTLGMILFTILALALVAVLPVLLGQLGIPGWLEILATLLRWPILAGAFIAILAVLYRYGPCREQAQWSWVTPGAVIATALWVVGSILFSWYITNFGDYNETYGTMGAVMVLMLWLWVSAFVVLIGAEINAEMEHQTERDTTRGEPHEMGQRGAHMADTVGEER